MKKKKLFALVMAMVMTMTLVLPAFAAGDDDDDDDEAGDYSVAYTTTTEVPVVTVTMPESEGATTILNPYGMSITIGEGDDATSDTSQVISAAQYIENKTMGAMKVGLTAKVTPSSDDVKPATKACTGKETTKSIFLVVELAETSLDADADPAAPVEVEEWFADTLTAVNEKAYPQVIPVTGNGKVAASVLSVAAATKNTDGAVVPNYIAFKVLGNMAGSPTEAWSSEDKADLTLEFAFTTMTANTITLDSTVSSAGVSASGTASVPGPAVRLTYATAPTTEPTWDVKDSQGNSIAVTKASDGVYFFAMPAFPVTVKFAS